MKRWLIALAAVVATLVATAGTALAADPVQSATQSSDTGQAALAASSATQVQPRNDNVSVRIFSPGDDGAVSQSNDAASSANASNTASTTQSASQTAAAVCGCVVPVLDSGQSDRLLPGATQAADPATAPADPPATGQSNDAASSGTASNAAPTTQSTSQAAPSGGGVQSSTQDASTDQAAAAASSAEQVKPSNSNVSVRILSPGNDGPVTQSNSAASSATAANTGTTTQSGTQTGGGSGVQSSTQKADTTQKALGLSAAKQIAPENSDLSVRIGSYGNGGSVSQSNDAASSATSRNVAPVTQTSSQAGGGSSCGCSGGKGGVQAVGQSSKVDQLGAAASKALQLGPSNTSDPVRIGSPGNDGSLTQSNRAASSAWAANTAPVTQSASQSESPAECGCSSSPAVQAVGQSSRIGQLGIGLSFAGQAGASNESGPVRVWSPGGGGSVSQANEAASSAAARNTAPTVQSSSQTQSGSGVQAAGQQSGIYQAGLAGSAALQLPLRSPCGCGASFGNTSAPVRIGSGGDDGTLTQRNAAASRADATNAAVPTQAVTQNQASGCGCGGTGVQALGQAVEIGQLAAALSGAAQLGASNLSGPVAVGSHGGAGSTSQANEAASGSSAPNLGRTFQTGRLTAV